MRLLHLIDLLQKKTDEEHPLSAAELCESLRARGVSAERKALYEDIAALQDFGYDIIQTRVPKQGYFLASRTFETSEIYLLCDAVQAAGFVTPKKTRELTSKLCGMLSDAQANAWKRQLGLYSRYKCDNEEIYYTIDVLNRAIAARRKVQLRYCRRELTGQHKIGTNEREWEISPYALTWVEDHYYLVGNHAKYDNLIHLRLDRMRNVTLLDAPARPFCEVSEYTDFFDIADYTRKTFHMFGGEPAELILRCRVERLEQVLDRFSDDLFIRSFDGSYFCVAVRALLSEGLIGWMLQFGPDIEVRSPARLREQLRSRAEALAAQYAAPVETGAC